MSKNKKKSPVLKLTGDLVMLGLEDEIVQKYKSFHLRKDYLMYMWKNVIKEYELPLNLLFEINGKKRIDTKLHIDDRDIHIVGKQLTSAYILTLNSFAFDHRESQIQAVFGKNLSSLCVDYIHDNHYRFHYIIEKNRCTFNQHLYNPTQLKVVMIDDVYTKFFKYEGINVEENRITSYYCFTKNKLINFEHGNIKIKFHSYTNSTKYKMAEYVDDIYNVAWFSKGNIKHLGQANKENSDIIDYVVYYRTGVVKTSHSFDRKTGLLTGKYVKYYTNGSVEFIGNYVNSNKDGLWIYKDREGQTLQRINWKNNIKHGTCYYYEGGKLFMKKIFENNKCIKRIKM